MFASLDRFKRNDEVSIQNTKSQQPHRMKVNDVKGKEDQKKKSYAKAVMGEGTSENIPNP